MLGHQALVPGKVLSPYAVTQSKYVHFSIVGTEGSCYYPDQTVSLSPHHGTTACLADKPGAGMQYCIVVYGTVPNCGILNSILYGTVLFFAVLFSTFCMYCTVWYCTVQ